MDESEKYVHIRLRYRTCYTLHPIQCISHFCWVVVFFFSSLFVHIAWNSIWYLLGWLTKSSGYVFWFCFFFLFFYHRCLCLFLFLFIIIFLSVMTSYGIRPSFQWLYFVFVLIFAYYAHDFNGLLMTSESGVVVFFFFSLSSTIFIFFAWDRINNGCLSMDWKSIA